MMFSFAKKQKNLALILSVYKSHISAKLFDLDSSLKLGDFEFQMNYLRTFSPKYELEKDAIHNAVHNLTKQIAKLSANLNLSLSDLQKIYIINHASLSKLKVNEFFVKLDKPIRLNKNVLLNLLKRHYAEEASFKESIFGNYVKESKVVSKVKPLYYDIKSWEGKVANEFSVILNQVYADKSFSAHIKGALLDNLPDRDFYFLHPVLFFLLNTDASSSVIVNIGAESMSAFQIYKDQVIDNKNINIGINHLVRKLEKKLGLSFELSASQIVMFLKGECQSEYCSLIEKEKENFVHTIKNEFNLSEFKSDMIDNIVFIYNPSIDNELVKFLANKISFNIDKNKRYEILDFNKIIDGALPSFKSFVHNDDFVIMLMI